MTAIKYCCVQLALRSLLLDLEPGHNERQRECKARSTHHREEESRLVLSLERDSLEDTGNVK